MFHTNRTPKQTTSADPFAESTAEYTALLAQKNLEVATFAGGCFWCMEGPFETQEGVVAAVVGFTGGRTENPTYKEVVSGKTGHREAVQVFYDPTKIGYAALLEIYWRQIDPTDPDGQFADRGEHYTTAVYYHSETQKEIFEEQVSQHVAQKRYDAPIVTKILPFTAFFPAEEYHQNFYIKSSEYYQQYAKGSGRKGYIEAMEQKYSQNPLN